jgi:hypothetical protein
LDKLEVPFDLACGLGEVEVFVARHAVWSAHIDANGWWARR